MRKESPYEVEIIVRGYELDAFNHVNHAVYLNYFEHARWMAFKEHIGLDEIAASGHSFIVRKVSVEYHKPAHVFDTLRVRLWVERVGNTSMVFGQDVVRVSDECVCATAEVVAVSLGPDGKPSRVPDSWRQYLV